MPIVVSPKRKRKRKFIVSKKIYVLFTLILIGAGGIFYALFGAGLFDVNFVKYEGLKTIQEESVTKIIDSYLDGGSFIKKRSNIFFVDLDHIEMEIAENLPKVKEIEIERKLFHGLFVNLVEKRSKGIYCTSNCYYFDDNGIAYETAPETEGFLVLNIKDFRNKEVSLGEPILEDSLLDSIYLTEELFKELTGLDIKEFIIPEDSFDEFWVETEEGWLVYMTDESPETKIEDLAILLENNFEDSRRLNLEYVDIRIAGRAYYKLKNLTNE